jgi:hypothetical protein
MVAARAGVVDCEAHDGGLFVQDVNTRTSLALVVGRRLPAFVGLAVASVAGGVDSALCHGNPG